MFRPYLAFASSRKTFLFQCLFHSRFCRPQILNWCEPYRIYTIFRGVLLIRMEVSFHVNCEVLSYVVRGKEC